MATKYTISFDIILNDDAKNPSDWIFDSILENLKENENIESYSCDTLET